MWEKNLHNVIKSAMRARELVKQILTFSRKTPFERSALALTPVIKETVQLLRASIPKTIDIKFSLRTASDTVLAFPCGGTEQILMNLATNASLAMEKTGGTLEIGLADADFGPDVMDMACGRICEDHGKGHRTRHEPRGNEEDIRAFSYTTREVGQGLRHGPRAWFTGSSRTSRARSPWRAKKGWAPPSGCSSLAWRPNRKRCLRTAPNRFEETGEYSLSMTRRCSWNGAKPPLKDSVTRSRPVTDSNEALRTFAAGPQEFDLVITDHAMPQMAGAQLSQELLRIRDDIPIILCTGHSETVSPERAKEIGIREYLMKPLARHELAEAVRRVLDARDAT